MAVKPITSIRRYVGLSTDVKPTAPIGSTFFEADTGFLTVLDGDGNWNNKKSIIGIDPAANAVQLSGSIPEYGWIDGDTEPTPTGFAFGAKVDSTTGNITCMYWNGIAWVEVE